MLLKAVIAQCNDGHLICLDCLKQHVKTLVFENKIEIPCIGHEKCAAGYSQETIRKALSEEDLYKKYEKIKQMVEIRNAGIADLVECPL